MCNGWGVEYIGTSTQYWTKNARVLDVGSLDVNGSAKDRVIGFCSEYIGVDMRPGKGVDIVLKAEDVLATFGKETFDVVVSTEMMEHVRNWYMAIYNMVIVLKPGGIMALTTRSPGFGRHEYPSDYWRFTQQNFRDILTPMGVIIETEDDPSGFPGVGVIFRKTERPVNDEDAKKWLEFMEKFPILSMNYGQVSFIGFEKEEKDEASRPFISLVMIVKNESLLLEKCLASVKPIVDEFVILDTGSTDGTQEIIKKYGTLHEMPFTNFVDTKNHALSLATGRYIMLLDADKTIIEGLEFVKEHARDGVDCLYADVVEGIAAGTPAQTYLCALLWKNNGEWKFDGPGVHEVIVGNKSPYTDHRIKVLHEHANRDAAYYTKRFESYVVLLNNYLQGHPTDPRATFYLGRTLQDLDRTLDAITQFKRYLSFNTNFKDERWQAAHDIAECWKRQGEYDRAFEACDDADKIDPRRAEIPIMRGMMYYELQDNEKAVEEFEKAASMPVPQDVVLFMNPRMHFEIPADYLVLLNNDLHNWRDSYESAQRLNDRLPKPDMRISNNLTFLRKIKSKKLFFTLGLTPESVYGGMIDKQGVGGVETTYIELPEELAKRGHECYVFCKCDNEHLYNGVWYIPYTKLAEYSAWQPDILITSRWFDSFYMFPNAQKIAWMQDAHYADPNHPDAWNIIDAFVCSSRWHRQYTAERLGKRLNAHKINIIPLAIRGELFEQQVERDPLNVIYSSNPSRGLYVLKPMWQKISEKVPGIHLTVTYGWEGLRTWSDDAAWLANIDADENAINAWAKEAGNIHITGRLPKKNLAQEMLASSLCLYPNDFWETFCLTALETQAAGVPMITTKLGALTTTLSGEGNVLIKLDPHSAEYTKEFILSTITLMKRRELLDAFSKECLTYFKNQPDWAKVAEMWEKLIYHL